MSSIDPFGSVEEATAPPEASVQEPAKATTKPAGKAVENDDSTDDKKPAGRKRLGVALAGNPVSLEDFDTPAPFPSWPVGIPDDTYIPQEEADYQDLAVINRDINRARAMSFRVKNRLALARHIETEVGDKYRKAYNRQMIGLSGGNEAQRKAIAEVNTEHIYSDFLVAQSVVKDLTNLSYTVSRDLDTLKTLSDNLRKQMSIQ